MDRLVFEFRNDISEKAVRTIGRLMRNQTKMSKNLILLSMGCIVYAVLQAETNAALKNEVRLLKYEVEKLKQKNGEE